MSKDKDCRPPWSWSRRESGRPSFMHGPRFSPFGFDGPRSGRMFAQGDLRLLLLALIADKPSHGYDLIRTIEARFSGAYAPSPGVVYPTLTLLEEQDLVRGETLAGGKKSYAVTEGGLRHLEEKADEVRALMARIDAMAGEKPGGRFPGEIMDTIWTLGRAVMARMGSWSPEEAGRVRAILERAAREIRSGGDKG